MNLIQALLPALGVMFAASVGMLAVMTFFTLVWVKRKTKGMIYCIFKEPNRHITRELLKIPKESEQTKSAGGGTYFVFPAKTFYTKWPPGLPEFMQELIPTAFYRRGNPEPYDPDNPSKLLSAKATTHALDENVLKNASDEARRSLDKNRIGDKSIVMWIAGGALAASLITGFLSWQILKQMTEFSDAVTRIETLLGKL